MARHENLIGAVRDLVAQPCLRAENPYGSIISLDFGALTLREDDAPTAKRHGWRHLTVLSPWRLQSTEDIIADWNVDGGVHGRLHELIQILVGDTISSADTSAPAWDLALRWVSGLTLSIFGDVTDDRDSAWYILGSDGLEVSASPILRPF